MTIATVFMRRENPEDWINVATANAAVTVRGFLQARGFRMDGEDYLTVRAAIYDAIEKYRPGVTLNIHPGPPATIENRHETSPAVVEVQTDGQIAILGSTIVVSAPDPPAVTAVEESMAHWIQEARDILGELAEYAPPVGFPMLIGFPALVARARKALE